MLVTFFCSGGGWCKHFFTCTPTPHQEGGWGTARTIIQTWKVF